MLGTEWLTKSLEIKTEVDESKFTEVDLIANLFFLFVLLSVIHINAYNLTSGIQLG
jgi:hypothetical protein